MLTAKLFTQTAEGLVASDRYEVDYVSLVNSDTFGAPPLVAPDTRSSGPARAPVAQVGEEVLYINTDLVPAFCIERTEDHA